MGDRRLVVVVCISGALVVGGAAACSSRAGSASASSVRTRDASISGDGGSIGDQPVVGQVDGGVSTKLPPLPAMTNVVATLNDDSVSIAFEPVEGALDYRVYPLPNDSDISVASDGHVVVHNAIYRCAGTRETPTPTIDNDPAVPGSAIHTQVDQQTVGGYLRTLAGATLGYVYTEPAAGLVPVYALGESDPNADTTCFFARWKASRVKKYTTSEAERTQLLAAFARDDGIAFYVPANPDSTTTQIYFDEKQPGTQYMARYYFPAGPEADAHPSKKPGFAVLTSQVSGTMPLMRVYYGNSCGWSHDELAVGKERFYRIYKQGDKQPWWSLLWSGLTGPTTLVVEALDTGCPFQGHLSPQSIPSLTAHFGAMPLIHEPYVTLDDVRAASRTTEVFINGQQGPPWVWNGDQLDAGATGGGGGQAPLPKAIARAFVDVAPSPHAKMDFFADFSPNSAPEVFSDAACGAPGGNCFATWRQKSATFDQLFHSVESNSATSAPLIAYGPVMGELWIAYADTSADTNGKYRLTANQKANMAGSTFLHVTMEVDSYSTQRRYPQMLISDQDAPVQYALDKGHTLIVQPRASGNQSIDYPIEYQLQICNLRTWDVNNQCPLYDLYHVDAGAPAHLSPSDEVGEHVSVDHRTLYDVFASTRRTYLFLDGQPYACADMPSVGVPSGPVTVTWGDVLYHSAVDHNTAFHADHQQIDTRRHFDNLGFSSGGPAPPWDESRLPCASPIAP